MTESSIAPKSSISYRRSGRAGRLRLTIHPDQTVTVTVPRTTPLQEARRFVRSKKQWIDKHLKKIREQEQNRPTYPDLSQEDLVRIQKDLFSRLNGFSKKYNLPYKKASFRCQKTTWGTCTGKNHINLNINIAYLPSHLQDYILLHELVHTRHKNHGLKFWTELDRYTEGRSKELKKELKGYGMRLSR